MMFTQVVLFASVVMGSAYAAPAGTGGSSYGSGPSSAGAVFPTYGSGAGRGQGQNEAPKPYNFEYSVNDGQGNVHYRTEQSDQNGRVKGTYGYCDDQGLYRVVEYTADENGFRAIVWTNEPGVDGKESPADVVMHAEQPPAGIYGPARGYGTSRPSGQGGSGTGAGQGGFSAGSSGASRPFCSGAGGARPGPSSGGPTQGGGGFGGGAGGFGGTGGGSGGGFGGGGYGTGSSAGRKGDDGSSNNSLNENKKENNKKKASQGEIDAQKKKLAGIRKSNHSYSKILQTNTTSDH